MKYILIIFSVFIFTSCNKVGVQGRLQQFFGDWAEIKVPDKCIPKQVAGEGNNGVILLCEDGRIFH